MGNGSWRNGWPPARCQKDEGRQAAERMVEEEEEEEEEVEVQVEESSSRAGGGRIQDLFISRHTNEPERRLAPPPRNRVVAGPLFDPVSPSPALPPSASPHLALSRDYRLLGEDQLPTVLRS
jgi:hypothetical protein